MLVNFVRPTQWKGGALFNTGERAAFEDEEAALLVAQGHAEAVPSDIVAGVPEPGHVVTKGTGRHAREKEGGTK